VNKTERMYAVVEELRAVAPRSRSASWLAARFEVSVRTIERDLSALQQAGVPIWASTGRSGGYAVDTSMTLPPLNFTPSEAAALVAAVAIAGPLPLAEAARSGLRKIATAMSPAERRRTGDLVQRILVPERDEDPPTGQATAAVVQALAERRVLEIEYRDKQDTTTRRTVEPAGFITVTERWYLVAWCRLRSAYRAFRVDRIAAATVCLEPAPDRPPPDEDCDLPTGLRELTISGGHDPPPGPA
jgi:predicted DNA-binding transcriptional regulator YafY